MSKADRIERIVIFADGTGNAFSKQESNVWRLYEALDLTRPEQVAFYIKGVGTAGFRPFALLDNATGIGVPSNVRKLYRFLCWNWRPGVEIYLFGFSRGAFTVRTLIGMIKYQGLVPTEFASDRNPPGTLDRPGAEEPKVPSRETVSRAEMRRNVRVAWRAYRAHTVPQVWWTVRGTRWIRDRLLALWGYLLRHRSCAVVAAETRKVGRHEIPIRFAGLFDTVEAYGVPFEELRLAIDRAIWPISFRNRVLSPHVDVARHALGLDDERTTFHPVRFDVSGEQPGSTRIREVWFAGVHSDVGGGYPDDYLSYLPLAWMMEEAEKASGKPLVIFKPGALDGIRAAASPLAAIHDSRAGAAVLYRYDPRRIDSDEASGGEPVIHHSVAEKMVFGTENYAPLTLPAKARVLMPDGSLHGIAGFQAAVFKAHRAGILPQPPLLDAASQAVQDLNTPDPDFVDLARDMIWWRRVCYFVLLAAALATVFLPKTAPWLDDAMTGMLASGAHFLGFDTIAAAWQQRLDDTEGGLASNLGGLFSSFGALVPTYATGWVQALVAQPLASFIILAVTASLYRLNGSLRDTIADLARCAWFSQGAASAARHDGVAARIARAVRGSRRVARFVRIVWDKVIPGAVLLCLAGAVLIVLNKTIITYRSGSGRLCKPTESASVHPPLAGTVTLPALFRTDAPCWPTGIFVEKGRTYRLWLEMVEPYRDGQGVVDIAGFATDSLRHRSAAPLLRRWDVNWFQPMARIGSTGTTEWPLLSVSGVTGSATGRTERVPSAWRHTCARPDPADPDTIARAQERLGIHKSFVAEFRAEGSGELFLFVNDAMLELLPFIPEDCFYKNNSGTARVTLQLQADPPVPAATR